MKDAHHYIILLEKYRDAVIDVYKYQYQDDSEGTRKLWLAKRRLEELDKLITKEIKDFYEDSEEQ